MALPHKRWILRERAKEIIRAVPEHIKNASKYRQTLEDVRRAKELYSDREISYLFRDIENATRIAHSKGKLGQDSVDLEKALRDAIKQAELHKKLHIGTLCGKGLHEFVGPSPAACFYCGIEKTREDVSREYQKLKSLQYLSNMFGAHPTIFKGYETALDELLFRATLEEVETVIDYTRTALPSILGKYGRNISKIITPIAKMAYGGKLNFALYTTDIETSVPKARRSHELTNLETLLTKPPMVI